MNSQDPEPRTSKLTRVAAAAVTTVVAVAMTTKRAAEEAISESCESTTKHQREQQRHNSREMRNNILSSSHGAQESKRVARSHRSGPLNVSFATPTKQRSHFSTKSISIACISYIIFNQLFMTALISSSDIVSNRVRLITSGSDQYKLSNFERSIVGLVAASPVPAPSPAALARSATSQRMPPMNGSIFGKRDLASGAREHRAGSGHTTSAPVDYNEIITNVIEDFMARNNEVDPGETTVAFCRMIVYECHQVLANHSSRSSRRGSKQRRPLAAQQAVVGGGQH